MQTTLDTLTCFLRSAFRIVRTAGLLCLLVIASCNGNRTHSVANDPKGETEKEQPTAPVATSGSQALSGTTSSTEPEIDRETWDVLYMGDARVGYTWTSTVPWTDDGQELVRTSSESHFTISRFGQVIANEMRYESIETRRGELRQLSSQVSVGPTSILTTGKCDGQRLQLTTQSLGAKQQTAFPWDAAWGGFFSLENSLRNQPIKPGETRTIRALMPGLTGVEPVSYRLEAADYELVELLSDKQKLLSVRATLLIGAQEIPSSVWLDAEGNVLKSEVMEIVAYRTSKDVALQPATPGNFDLGVSSVVKVNRKITNPQDTHQAVYRATLRTADPTRVFASQPSQQITRLDTHSIEVVVRALRPGEALHSSQPEAPPVPEDLQANNLIQSDDPRIVSMAAAVAADESDPWKVACALEEHVHRSMTRKNFSQAFATASDVAERLEGDCTEHAVLLAALCRARGIPTRVVTGLVYASSIGGFAFHMWDEVWIGDRWFAVDATLGNSGIGATHLKLGHSDLSLNNVNAAILPVALALKQLELEVVKVE